MILAGDIGATKTHLGLYRAAGGGLTLMHDHIYSTQHFPSLEAVLSDFIKDQEPIAVACLGVPGPVIGGFAHPTNIGWEIYEQSLSTTLNGASTRLINDLAATAYGMLHLEPSDVVEIHKGEELHQASNIAVIAAGTGLGEAGLIAARTGWIAVASEGGHCDFAPRGTEQVALLQFLEREFGHASYERVVSGPGLHNLYRFLLEYLPQPEPESLKQRMAAGDASAVISEVALAGQDPRCVHALELFTDIYGAEAANLALKLLAFGGLYIGGGIAPKILPFLQQGGFMRSFLNKGRLNAILERLPVRISLNEETALLGAAHLAASMTAS
ncbi:MAG: glucokinase [Deltaproteobacteria bacterium]|nr:glucokinase [Deltaproteobacteria bacterium]